MPPSPKHTPKHKGKEHYSKKEVKHTPHFLQSKKRKAENQHVEHKEVLALRDEIKEVKGKITIGKQGKHSNKEPKWKFTDMLTCSTLGTAPNGCTGSEGLQGVNYLGNFLFVNQILGNGGVSTTMSNIGSNAQKYSLVSGLMLMNPYQITTGNQGGISGAGVPQSTAAYAPVDDMIRVENLRLRYRFFNGTLPIPVRVSVYVVTSKKPVIQAIGTTGSAVNGAIEDWAAALTAVATPYPAAISSTNAGAGKWGGNNNINFIDNHPTDTRTWNKQYKVLARRDILMVSGSQIDLEFDIEVNTTFDKQTLQKMFNDNVGGIPNKSIQVFMITQGGIVKAGAGSTYSPGAHEIGWCATAEYNCTSPKQRVQRNQSFYIAPAFISGDTLAQQITTNVVDATLQPISLN